MSTDDARRVAALQRLARAHEMACHALHASTTLEGESTARAEVLRLERELARLERDA